mmetsp:Transcript_60697/g.136738  ORF Transcript_60697/g.136738 Transcript_60697/m.136738 type:complete len:100 (+) Transcript_60697:1765-2064(+)
MLSRPRIRSWPGFRAASSKWRILILEEATRMMLTLTTRMISPLSYLDLHPRQLMWGGKMRMKRTRETIGVGSLMGSGVKDDGAESQLFPIIFLALECDL